MIFWKIQPIDNSLLINIFYVLFHTTLKTWFQWFSVFPTLVPTKLGQQSIDDHRSSNDDIFVENTIIFMSIHKCCCMFVNLWTKKQQRWKLNTKPLYKADRIMCDMSKFLTFEKLKTHNSKIILLYKKKKFGFILI